MTSARRLVALVVVVSLLLLGCSLVDGGTETASVVVDAERGGEVSVADASVTIPPGGVSSDATLEISTQDPPASRPGLTPVGRGLSVTLQDAELTGEATVSFVASASDFPDDTVPVVVWEDGDGGWRWLPTSPVADGRVVATTDHFSSGFLARLDPRALATDLADGVRDYVTGRSGVAQPACGDEQAARAVVDVTSDGGDAVKWCLGLENGRTVLKIANNRRTFAQITYPDSWQVQEGLKASISSDALVRALGTGAASLGLRGRDARVIDGGDTLTLVIPDGDDGRATVEASLTSWALTGIKFGVDVWMSAAGVASGKLDDAAQGSWERIANAINRGDDLDGYGAALAACGEGVQENFTEDIDGAEILGALVEFQIDCVPALMQADIEETGFTMFGLGFVLGLVEKVVSLVATAANLVLTGLREIWDNIASFGGRSDAIYDILVTGLAAAGTRPRPSASPRPSTGSADGPGGPEPILFVFDTSGSMSDAGPDGVIRLEGAKAAAVDSVYALPAQANAGVWAYPDDGGCGAGRSVLDVSELDVSRLTAEIQNLQPNGNTPTAAALRAATDSLITRGYMSGTIVLASDGEANCQEDPCEVARQIVADGFDLTVNTAGINISTEGLQQLQCIADATGGQYYDVKDAQQLTDSLRSTSQPDLRLEVTGHEGTARAGSRATITAKVVNGSPSIDASDVTLSLSFLNTDTGGLALTAIPPAFRVGNIPAGESVTRSWLVSTAGEGTAYTRVLAQPSEGLAAQIDGELIITATPATLEDAGSLLADAERVVILGDSYSSGEGAGTGPEAGSYVTDGTPADDCHRSLNTYALQLYGINDDAAIIACSGAVTADYLSGNDERDRLPQVSYLDQAMKEDSTRPDVVLLTFGGNDIGFAGLLKSCADPRARDQDCTTYTTRVGTEDRPVVDVALADAANMRGRLSDLYVDVATLLGNATPAGAAPVPVVVLPYVQVLTSTYGDGCSNLNERERQFALQLLRVLNTSVAGAVEDARARGALVYYAQDVAQALLPGHTACADKPEDRYANPIELAKSLNTETRQELMHPNTPGYRAVTDALVDWSGLPAVEEQWAADRESAQPTGGGSGLTIPLTFGTVSEINLAVGAGADPQRVIAGGDLKVTAGGFTPGSDVRLVVRSTPMTLAHRTADDDGRISATVTIPPELAAGRHSLSAEGWDDDGEPRVLTQSIRVTPLIPAWIALIAAASLLGMAAAWHLHRRGWRRPTGQAR